MMTRHAFSVRTAIKYVDMCMFIANTILIRKVAFAVAKTVEARSKVIFITENAPSDVAKTLMSFVWDYDVSKTVAK